MRYRSFLFVGALIGVLLLVSGCANHRAARFLIDLCTAIPSVAQSYVELLNRELDNQLPGATVHLICPTSPTAVADATSI